MCIWCMLSCTIRWPNMLLACLKMLLSRDLLFQHAQGSNRIAQGYDRIEGTEVSSGNMDAVRLMGLHKGCLFDQSMCNA